MQIYNINKMKRNVSLELENRVDEHLKKHLSKEKYIQGKSTSLLDDIYSIESNTIHQYTLIGCKTIKNTNLKEDKLKIINGAKVEFNDFINCRFNNIKFKNCTFFGTKFSKCVFENIIFEGCTFFKENEIAIFNEGSLLKKTSFKNCNIRKSVFKNTIFEYVKISETILKETIIANTSIINLKIIDCDCRMFKIVNSNADKIIFEDEYNTRFDEYTFFDQIIVNQSYKKSYENASKVYREIAVKFEKNNLSDYAGEYYYLSKKAECKSLSGIDRVKSWIFWMLCGYGERPTYALVTSVEIILIFAIIYMFTGLIADGSLINYTDLFSEGIVYQPDMYRDFFKSLYFSIATFTTVGYGDITPVGEISTMLSGIEMFLGVTMVGIWTATLARKIIR
ncbi:MAG: ion channel [Peptostreptococcaceae bacterium]